MCSYAPNQHNCDFIAHFRFDPVRSAFDVENHSVVAQKAGAWVPRLNIGWAGPIRFLNLENPRAEGAANIGVLLCELCQQLLPH